ncbi:MAG: NUDIX domain-containing protein [Flavipsychrobacter sp.]|nr:NUDIX domain-containing protein [Flavipsychrobacter sp.]
MPKQSAGILVYRKHNNQLQVLLVHPGGPFFAKKDLGAWSIPKGEFTTEDPLAAAIREFKEELGIDIAGNFEPLTSVKLKSGKMVHAWAIEVDLDISETKSNTFIIEWPPRSGKMQEFPEVDKVEWFTIADAKEKINATQIGFIEELN